MFDTSRATAHAGGEGYPLRPELVESFVHACVDTPNFKRGLGFRPKPAFEPRFLLHVTLVCRYHIKISREEVNDS